MQNLNTKVCSQAIENRAPNASFFLDTDLHSIKLIQIYSGNSINVANFGLKDCSGTKWVVVSSQKGAFHSD